MLQSQLNGRHWLVFIGAGAVLARPHPSKSTKGQQVLRSSSFFMPKQYKERDEMVRIGPLEWQQQL